MRPKNDVTNPNPSPSQHLAHCDPTYHLRCAKPYKLITRFIPNQCGTQTYIKCLKHTHTPTQGSVRVCARWCRYSCQGVCVSACWCRYSCKDCKAHVDKNFIVSSLLFLSTLFFVPSINSSSLSSTELESYQ
mgnify:CR=1 FL=1